MAQQYSMTRNGIHSVLCFAMSIHIPKIRAKVSTSQKTPSKASSWRDWASLLVMYLRNFRIVSFSPRERELDGLWAPGLRRVVLKRCVVGYRRKFRAYS